MAVGDAHVFPGFLTPVLDLTQLSSQSHRLLFSHALDVRGEKKVRLNRVSNSQPPGHESDTLTTEPPCRSEHQPFPFFCQICKGQNLHRSKAIRVRENEN